MLFAVSTITLHNSVVQGDNQFTLSQPRNALSESIVARFMFYDNNDDYLFALYPVLQALWPRACSLNLCLPLQSAFSEFTVE